MSKNTFFQLTLIVLILLSILLPLIGQTGPDENSQGQNVDTIPLSSEDRSTTDEMPAVYFRHDLHSRAVDGKCTTCHVKTNTGFDFAFKTINNKPPMDFFHDNCTGCHAEQKAAGETSGPATAQCRLCHVGEEEKAPVRGKIVFDSLHYLHEDSLAIKGKDPSTPENCSACHHSYDEKTKTLVYISGDELPCYECHFPESSDGIPSLRQASHESCVGCHQTMADGKTVTGPVNCSDCHDQGQSNSD